MPSLILALFNLLFVARFFWNLLPSGCSSSLLVGSGMQVCTSISPCMWCACRGGQRVRSSCISLPRYLLSHGLFTRQSWYIWHSHELWESELQTSCLYAMSSAPSVRMKRGGNYHTRVKEARSMGQGLGVLGLELGVGSEAVG